MPPTGALPLELLRTTPEMMLSAAIALGAAAPMRGDWSMCPDREQPATRTRSRSDRSTDLMRDLQDGLPTGRPTAPAPPPRGQVWGQSRSSAGIEILGIYDHFGNG